MDAVELYACTLDSGSMVKGTSAGEEEVSENWAVM